MTVIRINPSAGDSATETCGHRWVAEIQLCPRCGKDAQAHVGNTTNPVTSAHWHVTYRVEDENPFAADTVFEALDFAADALSELVDLEHDGISVAGEAGDFEMAYRMFKNCETWSPMAANAANIAENYRLPADSPQRAPRYRGDADEAAGLLLTAALHVVDEINACGPQRFTVYECSLDECTPIDAEVD